jgi:uncharacterized protein YkwD
MLARTRMLLVRTFVLGAALCAIALATTQPGVAPRSAQAAGDCTIDATLDAEEKAFLVLVNNHRAANGRAPLRASYTLSRAAAWKSKDMGVNRYFAHDDLTRTWVDRIRDCGYGFNTYIGENILAGGSGSAQGAFDAWRNSPGHNANMLSSNFAAVGIGRHYTAGSPYGWYWTTEFGGYDDGYVTMTDPVPPASIDPAASTAPAVDDAAEIKRGRPARERPERNRRHRR